MRWFLGWVGKTLYQIGICIVATMVGTGVSLRVTIGMLEQSYHEHGWWMLLWLPWTALVSASYGFVIMGGSWLVALVLVWLTNRSFQRRMIREASLPQQPMLTSAQRQQLINGVASVAQQAIADRKGRAIDRRYR